MKLPRFDRRRLPTARACHGAPPGGAPRGCTFTWFVCPHCAVDVVVQGINRPRVLTCEHCSKRFTEDHTFDLGVPPSRRGLFG